MSESENDSGVRSRIFSSAEFMEFLAKQAGDISKLEVTTKSGDRISASFNGFDSAGESGGVFKSLDALGSLISEDLAGKAPAVAAPTAGQQQPHKAAAPADGFFTSREWLQDYGRSHVDVTYDKTFEDSLGIASAAATSTDSAAAAASSVSKKRTGNNNKTDWNAMFSSKLTPLVEAAARAQPQPLASQNSTSPAKSNKGGDKKRKPRKVVPEKMQFVDTYTDQDVLFGRGGRSNHHPGNKVYRDLVIGLQDHYRGCDKNEKTQVAQALVDKVNKEQKGRFLERDTASGRYYIVPNIMARRKVGQALRENNTEEARAAKREKYGQGKSRMSPGSSTSGSAKAGNTSKIPTLAV